MRQNGETYISTMEEGNLSRVSTIFSSKSPIGINVDAKIVRENINNFKSMSLLIGADNINKGNIAIDIIDVKGNKYTTADDKPLKREIKRLEDFSEEAKSFVYTIL